MRAGANFEGMTRLQIIPLLLIVLGSAPPAAALEILDAARISAELRADLGDQTAPRVDYFDHHYLYPDHDWVVESFIPYFREYVQLLTAGQAAALSESQFANLFKTRLAVSNSRGGLASRGEVACAVVTLKGQNGEADRSGVLLRTDRGWFLLEPRAGTLTALASAPHARRLARISF